MIDLEVVDNEINKIEVGCDTSYRACERLAWLYVVRDHLIPKTKDGVTTYLSGSEFLEAASGVNYQALMQVLNEHMQALSVLQPRVYESVMSKIRDLKK